MWFPIVNVGVEFLFQYLKLITFKIKKFINFNFFFFWGGGGLYIFGEGSPPPKHAWIKHCLSSIPHHGMLLLLCPHKSVQIYWAVYRLIVVALNSLNWTALNLLKCLTGRDWDEKSLVQFVIIKFNKYAVVICCLTGNLSDLWSNYFYRA